MEEPTASDTAAGSRAGSRFGHYLLRRLLGRGGFGEVYEAEDTVMDRMVALKLLAAPYSQNQVFRQRLYREARAAGRLHEPHVVPIHQCGEIDGQLYIDMRLIEGTDLQTVLARDGPLSPARAVAIMRQIASALDAAHTDQMIHRDVKPANILLTGDDFACLVDFGLANAATDAKLTSSGTTIGTFAYMAPERLSNTEVSHRADIYSLACVLYECLTGSPPYAIGDLPALITAHLTAPIPRPSQQQPQVPAAFDDVIARGMAKNPEDRYASAGDLARAAHRALTVPEQDDADTILASTQAARQPDQAHAPSTDKPPANSPTKRRPTVKPPTKSRSQSAKPPASINQQRRAQANRKLEQQLLENLEARDRKRNVWTIVGLSVLAVIVVLVGIEVITKNTGSTPTAPSTSTSAAMATPDALTRVPALPPFLPTADLGANCQYEPSQEQAGKPVNPPRQGKVPTDPAQVSVSMVTSQGNFGLLLANNESPCTVNSFVSLAQQKFFDNTQCHRLTASPTVSILQCGDPTGDGSGGP
ncbi:MAG: protein kinase domain-containing protein, partial [Mycobacterium sp.]